MRVPMAEGRADSEGCADNIPTISTALFGQGAVLMGKAVQHSLFRVALL